MRQEPRPNRKQPAATWRDELHPFFVHATEYYKRIAILSASDLLTDRAKAEKLKRERPKKLLKEADQVTTRSPLLAIALGLDPNRLPPPNSEISLDVAMRNRFAFFKYGKTCAELEGEKNWKALGEIEGLMRKAAFHPSEVDNWATKTNRDHYVIMAAGIGMGLEKLGKNELAACFDELCPCGLRYHSGESLRQLRSKMLRLAATLAEPGSAPTRNTAQE
jgi:hypothetical protein